MSSNYTQKKILPALNVYVKFPSLCWVGCWLRSMLPDWYKVRWVSIIVWTVLCVYPHWTVVIQQTTLSVDDNIYIYIYIYIYLTDKMKRSFFQAAVVLILLYGCTIWTLTKQMEKRLDGKYTRTLRAILNKSWRQLPITSSYTATYHLTRKLSKLNEPDMRDITREVGTSL